MKIALAQMNPTIGDIRGNREKILLYLEQARKEKADLVIFPEMALLGWPPKDMLLRRDFISSGIQALNDILPHTSEIGVLLGSITQVPNSGKLYNSAILIENCSITGQVNKCQLKSDHIFDESKYFLPAQNRHQENHNAHAVHGDHLVFRGLHLKVFIHEDFCKEQHISHGIPDLYINLSAYPYQYQESKKRQDILSSIASQYRVPTLSVNQVGANDELIFDGSSMIYDKEGRLIGRGKPFEEQLLYFDTDASYQPLSKKEEDISWVYQALVLGIRDYCHKTGLRKVLLGLSGGIDSALVACLAVDALGRKNVLGVSMPSRYSSEHSRGDAKQLADNLDIEYRTLSIEEPFDAYIKLLNDKEETVGDLAEENIQARIRGNLLMFLSNREGYMLVNTSNKSEAAMGYSTLYGDMCGGLSPIADIPKTMVYELCSYINREREVIPVNTLAKPPSAELRPNQLDQDSLPDYSVLDAVIELYLEENLTPQEIADQGYDRQLVLNIINMIDRTEYKRRQTPPLLKVTSHTIRTGGSMPMVQRFQRNGER